MKSEKYLLPLFVFLLIFSSCTLLKAQPNSVETVRQYYHDNGAAILQEYTELLKIPNVSTNVDNMRRNAEWIRNAFEKRGVNMELLEHPDNPEQVPPVIYGELKAENADRTLLVYVHYDGQPVDPQNWTHAPWQPTLYSASMPAGGEPIPFPEKGEKVNPDWRIYGRSASDDKAPIPALLATLEALQKQDIPLTSNIRFFFDGEEERGSPHIKTYLETYREKLQGDLWLFFDGPKHQSGRPQVVFGVRGVTGMEVTVYGANRSLHSGHYGGWAPVPGQILVDLLDTMKDPSGKVLIEDFYKGTRPITEADRRAFATLPDVDEQIRKDMGLSRTEFGDRSLIESYMYPTLTIRGLKSGNVGEKARNVIPSTATVTLGIRLAKGNDPEVMKDLVEAHIRDQGFHIVRKDPDLQTRLEHRNIAKVIRKSGYEAVRTPINHPRAQQVVQAVRDATTGEVILYPTMGGTLPLFHFTNVLDTPLVIVPIANHDNNQHAPDENIRVGNIWYGIEIYSSIFTME